MKKIGIILPQVFILLLLVILLNGCKKEDNLENIDCSKISSGYSSNIRAIINANCLSSGCHNSGSTYGDFTTYTGLKSKADNGSLESRVIDQKNMPLSDPLSIDDLKKIKCWLNSGAPNN